MPTLHTVNKSPFATPALKSCLEHALDGDAILMIEDAVYGGAGNTAVADMVAARSGAVSIYVLEPDFAARGLAKERLIKGVTPLDYAGFVDLAAKNDLTHAWL
ncbi:tRNA 5-methylaminomethyl-2-thiouridine synthase subunit TusB [hydrothermal vent metagenome]|uniref:tRNA 5-methylaminomethyl-2-thiouridine synthase subunit TusB n=1 Tax=hydrothermal vent metagenome TaxID=652676 RepID=A0A3B0UFA3_9ZZZZ